MIINGLRARNVLKYARLEVTDIPEQGLIAICGPNESGKTAVVETICFALFGRTFSLPPEEIVKVIRWGETGCSVELDFTVGAGERYRISRSLGNDGVHGATLHRMGSNQAMASGAHAVRDVVVGLCGFTFEQYLDSLYLAQREISAPHSQSETIKAVAGGVPLERVSRELRADVLRERAHIEEIEAQVEAIRGQIEGLDISDEGTSRLELAKLKLREEADANDARVAELRATSGDLQAACQHLLETGRALLQAGTDTSYATWRRLAEGFSTGLTRVAEACRPLDRDDAFCEAEALKDFVWEYEGKLSAFDPALVRAGELRRDLAEQLGERPEEGVGTRAPSLLAQQAAAAKALGRARRWRWLAGFNLLAVLVLTAGAWAAWHLLSQRPDADVTLLLSGWLGEYLPGWRDAYLPRLLPAAAGLGLASVLLLLRAAYVSRQVAAARARREELERSIQIARHRAELLDELKEGALPGALVSLEDLQDRRLSEMAAAFAEGPGEALLDEAALESLQTRLRDLLQVCDNQLREAREAIAARIGGLQKENEGLEEEIAERDRDIVREQDRRRSADELSRRIDELRDRIPEHDDRVRLLELAHGLVRGTCQDLYSRFNRVLRRYTSEVMPLLTGQRYQHMHIDDSLNVQVFSTEKNDFAGLDELSSGTQRQVMLAVRLAMAKALTEASVPGTQFLILDEPFAFFDRERTRSTLAAIPGIDPCLSQNWIISQEFESDTPFTLTLSCARDVNEMVCRGSQSTAA
jgi:DNA repair exonuclease SbcCD ATPase subunit